MSIKIYVFFGFAPRYTGQETIVLLEFSWFQQRISNLYGFDSRPLSYYKGDVEPLRLLAGLRIQIVLAALMKAKLKNPVKEASGSL